MKFKLYLLFFLSISLNFSFSQTVSQNWTHNDCMNNNSYSLFNMLDSNKVVVMEFEMGCYSCVVAALNLESIKQSYDVSYPGQVKFFLMDYWANHTCSNVQTMINNNALSYTGFVGCAADKNYYTGSSPMPMIVVTGGPNHTVYYKSLSYDTIDNTAIISAINQALSDIAANVYNVNNTSFSVSLASNPAFKEVFLNITSPGNQKLSAEVYNVLGERVLTQKIELINKGFNQVKLELPELKDGVYFVKYQSGNITKSLKFIYGK